MSFNSVHTLKISPPSTLRKDLSGLLHEGLFTDVTFVLEGKYRINAHKAILASRCEMFRNMLSSQMLEANKDEIEIKDTSVDVFRNIINYIYTDQADISDLSMVVNLLVEADKYNLSRLKYL